MKEKSSENSKTSQKSKSLKSYDGRVQVEYLTGKATREFNERMGLSESALVISSKLKKSPES